MGKIWLIGNTGVRNPMRIQDAFRIYSESGFVGNIRGVEREIAFMRHLAANGILNNEQGRDPSGSYARKFRLMFNKMGFAYGDERAYPGVSQDDIGPIDGVTPFGRSFLNAETVPAVQEFFIRAQSVRLTEAEGGRLFSPLRWTIAVMMELRNRTGEASLTFSDFAAYVQMSDPGAEVGTIVDSILAHRAERDASAAKKRYDTNFYRVLFEGNVTKAATCKDYADMNIRYLKATGLFHGKGKGFAIGDEKIILAEKIAEEEQFSDESMRDRLAHLYNSAPLPSDDKEVARTVLDGLVERLRMNGVEYVVDPNSLTTAVDLNTACHNIEERLSMSEEEKFAKDQKNRWEEIADYMDLLIQHKNSKVYDDDREIKVPKEEASAYLEWSLWRAFLAMNTLKNKPYEIRRF